MKGKVRYTVIIPVYNEEAVVHETYRRLTQVMQSTGEPYELLFVNDGSRDRTVEIIEGLATSDDWVRLLDFSVTLILLGVLGEYVGRIYDETKNRPLYVLRNEQSVDNSIA